MIPEEYLSHSRGLLVCDDGGKDQREKHERKSHLGATSTIAMVRGVKMMEVVEVEEGAEERSWVLK